MARARRRDGRSFRERVMLKQRKPMTPDEFVHDVGGIALWLFAAILVVLGLATFLEVLAGF